MRYLSYLVFLVGGWSLGYQWNAYENGRIEHPFTARIHLLVFLLILTALIMFSVFLVVKGGL